MVLHNKCLSRLDDIYFVSFGIIATRVGPGVGVAGIWITEVLVISWRRPNKNAYNSPVCTVIPESTNILTPLFTAPQIFLCAYHKNHHIMSQHVFCHNNLKLYLHSSVNYKANATTSFFAFVRGPFSWEFFSDFLIIQLKRVIYCWGEGTWYDIPLLHLY